MATPGDKTKFQRILSNSNRFSNLTLSGDTPNTILRSFHRQNQPIVIIEIPKIIEQKKETILDKIKRIFYGIFQ